MTTTDIDRIKQLHTQIDAIEQRLALHRTRLGTDVRGIARHLRAKVVAPSSIMLAVALGVVVEQGSRDRRWSLAPVLQGLGVANSLIALLGPLVKSLNSEVPGTPSEHAPAPMVEVPGV